MVVKEWVARQHSSESKNKQRNFLPEFSPQVETGLHFLSQILHLCSIFLSPRHSKFNDLSRPGHCRAVSVFHPGSELGSIQLGIN